MNDDEHDFNDGFIKASSEAHNLLIDGGYKRSDVSYCAIHDRFVITENTIRPQHYKNELSHTGYKQFYINNGVLSWDKPYHLLDMGERVAHD